MVGDDSNVSKMTIDRGSSLAHCSVNQYYRRRRPFRETKEYSGLVNLASEFRRFTLNSVQLRRLYSETLKALDDISTNGVIPKESIKNLEWKVKEVNRQKKVVGRPPCIVVLGQNCRVKAILVNEIFGETHLPVLDSTESSSSWRMIRFKYSNKKEVVLTLGTSYELIEHLPGTSFIVSGPSIRKADLTVPESELDGPVDDCAVVEHHLDHPLLYDNAQVVVPPTGNRENFTQIIRSIFDVTTPIVMFGISSEILSDEDITQLQTLRSILPTLPIFFVHMPSCEESSGLTEVDRNEIMNHGTLNFTAERERAHLLDSYQKIKTFYNNNIPTSPSGDKLSSLPHSSQTKVIEQLVSLGFLQETGDKKHVAKMMKSIINVDGKILPAPLTSEYIHCLDHLCEVQIFAKNYLQAQLVNAANHLHHVHSSCLQMFILSAFEIAREMQITPKRLEYARMKEGELLQTLMRIAEKKQDEMCILIQETINERREDILQKAEGHQFKDSLVKNWDGPLSGKLVSQCIEEIRELVVLDLNNIIAQKLISSVYCLHDTFLGTLERCVTSLEKNLSEHLDSDGSPMASACLKQILSAAYEVEVPNHHSSSLLRGLYDKMKHLMQSLPWSCVPSIDGQWRRTVADDMLNSLCQWKLARAVCAQLKERLRTSHEAFTAALKHLEIHHNERLERTGEQGFRLRKVHAPRLARLSLETSSISDYLLYGMPQCGKEIGRGQYGVVFACESWAGHAPVAVKSVVPMDDKHWNDLAMEFYYMRSIPEHDRIVRVRGSVIDHSYAGGTIPSVLIVMDRLCRDLYCALKLGLPWLTRLQVALDVVSGIRYLHSQGLVHRDIKLKNILLDQGNRAKLTDLGFCKPEAMMSGSIVGTPIHMAPELFSGQYDNSVDVYAFGILFWYLCAGKIKLPQSFEQCQDKEHLWYSVKKGSRPEKLPYFDEECWHLMENCWAADPTQRPLLGAVEPVLESIKARYDKIQKMSQEYSLSDSNPEDPSIFELVASGSSPGSEEDDGGRRSRGDRSGDEVDDHDDDDDDDSPSISPTIGDNV